VSRQGQCFWNRGRGSTERRVLIRVIGGMECQGKVSAFEIEIKETKREEY